MSDESVEELTATSLGVARSLLDGWGKWCQAKSHDLGQRGKRPNLGRLLSIHSLAAHAHDVGELALDRLDAERPFEAAPLIRAAFESAVTAMWLAQNDDGVAALFNEDWRQREASIQQFKRGTTILLKEAAEELVSLEDDRKPSASNPQAKNFEQLCEDLTPGGADLYMLYRHLSPYCHPSGRVVDAYVVVGSDGLIADLRYRPDPRGHELLARTLALSLLWAGTAVDYIDLPARQRRSETREAARALGVARDLHLTGQAQLRINRWRQAARAGSSQAGTKKHRDA